MYMLFDRVDLAQLRVEVIHIAAQDSPFGSAFGPAGQFSGRTRIITYIAHGESAGEENSVIVERRLLG